MNLQERRKIDTAFFVQNNGGIDVTPEQIILDHITYRLIRTTKRLTFEILYQTQDPRVTWYGADDGDYYTFQASNGYTVISRSVMDIQSERIWLRGGSMEERAERSGSMVFGSDERRDKAYEEFHQALWEWNEHINRILGNHDED